MSDGIEYGGDGCPCERCGRPRGPRGCALLDSQGCLLTALLAARALAGSRYERLQDLETEVAAWRALAECRAVLHLGSDTGRYFFAALGKVATVDTFETPGEAAVASARQLKLIPEAK